MGRNIFRQDTQIRKSIVYLDTLAPSEAQYEQQPTNSEDDFNTLRSQIQNILNRDGIQFPTGHWWDDLSAPSTLEIGRSRGINSLNTSLHVLEKKRFLRNVIKFDTSITVPTATHATALYTLSSNVSNNETVTIGNTVYTFKNILTPTEGEILIGNTPHDTLNNLLSAITHGPGYHTRYEVATAHTLVTAAAPLGNTLGVEALLAGTAGNTVVVATTASTGSWNGNTHLTNGAGDVIILTTDQLPLQSTAAIGAVTTLGTVAVQNTTFGTAALTALSGTHPINPKNRTHIFDVATWRPLLSDDRPIWGLFQTESATNGHTLTDTTPNRAMITFVRPDVLYTHLEPCPITDIAGKTISYATRERVRLEDLNEQDLLHDTFGDVGIAIQTRTRENIPLVGPYNGINRLFALPEPAVHEPPKLQVKIYHGGRRLNAYEYSVIESVPGSGHFDHIQLAWAPTSKTQLVADYYVAM